MSQKLHHKVLYVFIAANDVEFAPHGVVSITGFRDSYLAVLVSEGINHDDQVHCVRQVAPSTSLH